MQNGFFSIFNKIERKALSGVANLVGVSSQCARVVGSIPGEGTRRNQPRNARQRSLGDKTAAGKIANQRA